VVVYKNQRKKKDGSGGGFVFCVKIRMGEASVKRYTRTSRGQQRKKWGIESQRNGGTGN